MRVLLVSDWIADRGGSEAYILWLRKGLQAAGDEVRFLTTDTGSAGDGHADYVARAPESLAAQAFLQIVNPFAVARVREAVREFRPEIAYVNLFAYHLSPAVLHALGRVPTVVGIPDYKVICPVARKLLPDGSLCSVRAGWVCHREGCVSLPHWLRDRPRYALVRSGLRRADRLLACSRWVQRELARDGIDSDPVELPVPSPSVGYRRLPTKEPLFTFVGRLEVEKGLPGLLRAFARVRSEHPSAHLRIVGRGSQARPIQRLSASLGLNGSMTMTGWQDPDGVERELAGAWALVAPSLWAEPLGLVALEAIVRGVPVIASLGGGFSETVDADVSGLLFPNGDEEALTDRMLEVASTRAFPDHRVPPEVVARVAARHSLPRHAEQMRGIFAEVIGRTGFG